MFTSGEQIIVLCLCLCLLFDLILAGCRICPKKCFVKCNLLQFWQLELAQAQKHLLPLRPTQLNPFCAVHERGQMGGIYEHGDLQSQDAQRETRCKNTTTMCSVTRTQDLQSQDAQTQAWRSRRVRMQKHNHGNTNTTEMTKVKRRNKGKVPKMQKCFL